MNKQVQKWFQNNDHQERVFSGEVKKRIGSSEPCTSATDAEFMSVRELLKEMQQPKKNWDTDKIVRLLSLTFHLRKNLDEPQCTTRITAILEKLPCLTVAIFVSIMCPVYYCEQLMNHVSLDVQKCSKYSYILCI